jgi:putative ABC transport system substrate-binding protein
MKRREFITLMGDAAAAWPLAARGQRAARVPVIGYLGATTAAAQNKSVPVFLQRLRELGWAESSNVIIEYRWAEGRNERAAEIATEFARLGVDVIVTSGAASVLAAKRATTSIPIVFTVASDPVGTGLVESLARPGGNVTGMSYQGGDLSGKRLELAREIAPGLQRLGVIANIASPGAALERREIEATAKLVRLELATPEIRQVEDLPGAFEMLKSSANVVYVCADPLVNNNRARIVSWALGARLPTIYGEREHVEAGGLLSYGPNLTDLFRRAADLVDKILRGTKPSAIPVEQPTKFDLVINLKTAKALGLDVPPTLIARANEVIE